MIVKENKKEHTFVKELIKAIKNIETNDISDVDCLDNIWAKNSKIINITKHSKS